MVKCNNILTKKDGGNQVESVECFAGVIKISSSW